MRIWEYFCQGQFPTSDFSLILPEQMVWKTNFGSALIVVLLLEYGHYFDEFWPEREIKVCQNTTITTFWQIIMEIDTTKQEGRSFWHVLCEKNRNTNLKRDFSKWIESRVDDEIDYCGNFPGMIPWNWGLFYFRRGCYRQAMSSLELKIS